MQPKISAFFNRQETDPDPNSGGGEEHGQGSDGGGATEAKRKHNNGGGRGELVSKKRNYAQFHLELGQRDFVLHTCFVCGMMYARGNDDDEKGWRNEAVIARSEGGDRVSLATDENSCMWNSKVKEVITVVEKELGFGEGKLLHKLCKVYLYISGQRIVGCLVAEPIKTAHRVIASSTEEIHSDLLANNSASSKTDHTLEFGKIIFKREIIRRNSPSVKSKEECQDPGAIICENEAVPALCGFRAIWVVPSRRRKRIGSKLMDVARKTFCESGTLGISQFAFSPPTSSGKALACRYCKTSAFLVYKDTYAIVDEAEAVIYVVLNDIDRVETVDNFGGICVDMEYKARYVLRLDTLQNKILHSTKVIANDDMTLDYPQLLASEFSAYLEG